MRVCVQSKHFSLATHQTGAVAALGMDRETWLRARASIMASLEWASTVLLAYGVQEPSGMARLHFREQVLWLSEEIRRRGLATVQFGNRPFHPSRWQRFTYRNYPDLDFAEALRKVLVDDIDSAPNAGLCARIQPEPRNTLPTSVEASRVLERCS